MHNFRSSLAVRLAMLSVLLGLVIGLLLSFIQLSMDFQQEKRSKEQSIQQLMSSLEDAAAEAAFHVDESRGRAVISGLFVLPSVYHAEIENDFGEPLVQKTSHIQVEEPNFFAQALLGDESTRERILRVPNYSAPVGRMRVKLDLNLLAEGFGSRVWLVITIEIIRSVLLSVMLALIFYFVLARPLSKAVNEIKSRKDGDKSSTVTIPKIHESDELGTLLASFNTLISEREEAGKILRNILDTSPVPLIITCLSDGLFRYTNPAAGVLFGLHSEELIGRQIKDYYVNPENREAIVAILEKDGEIKNFEVQIKQVDETQVWVNLSGRLSNFEGEMVLISGLFDITERKRAGDELRKLAQAVEQSQESIVITNLNAEIEYVNKAFLSTTGYSYDEVIGKNSRLLQSGKTPSETYHSLWKALIQGQSWQGELYNKRKNGSEYTEFAHITPIHQEDGIVSHYLAVKEDVTEKKRLTKELDVHRHHLESLVAKRTKELEEAQKKAEAANQAKSTFLTNMSHEIRTPMNAIIGFNHLLKRTELSLEQKNWIDKTELAAEHLLSIINDIMDLSKIEAGKLMLEQSNFNLDGIFDHIQSMVREKIRSKELSIEVDHSSVPQWLRGDPTRLSQALLNYVSNAVKFTDRGLITLRAKILKSTGDDLLIRFEVQDSGIGIEAEKLSNLFKPFEQADASTTRQYGGTGLGLAINRHLAELMGGETGAESKIGQGSIFWFTARLGYGLITPQDEPFSRLDDAELILRTRYKRAHILLVEDNATNLEVALGLLKGVGLFVDTASNGQEAVSKVSSTCYDLVLMDIQMPVMDGMEATQVIRSMKNLEMLPILAMTANVFEEDRLACLKVGMNDFVAKPVYPENLYSTIVKWLPERLLATETNLSSGLVGREIHKALNQSANDLAVRDLLMLIEGLDSEAGLRNLCGDVTAYVRLLSQFECRHIKDVIELSMHIEGGINDEARHITHTLKGAAGTLGLSRLQAAAEELDEYLYRLSNKGSEVDKTVVASLEDEIRTEFENLHQALAGIVEKTTSVVPDTVDTKQVQEVIEHIRELLRTDDASVNAVYAESRELLFSVYGVLMEPLEQQIEDFDYPSALETIEAILEKETHL